MTIKARAITNLKQMCSDGRYLGSGSYAPLEVLEDFNLAIEALEQETVLDKIKAEIETWHKEGTNWSDIRLMNIEEIIKK